MRDGVLMVAGYWPAVWLPGVGAASGVVVGVVGAGTIDKPDIRPVLGLCFLGPDTSTALGAGRIRRMRLRSSMVSKAFASEAS